VKKKKELIKSELPIRGRPTEYKEEYVQKLLDYFSKPLYKEVSKKITTKKGDVIEITEEKASDFPTLAGFALSIGHHRETLLEWAKIYPNFSDAYKKAKDQQENFLVINGLKGLVEQPMVIFTAKNVLNWRDKKDVELTGQLNAIPDEELDQKIQQLMEKNEKA
jgi:hypothetical protein